MGPGDDNSENLSTPSRLESPLPENQSALSRPESPFPIDDHESRLESPPLGSQSALSRPESPFSVDDHELAQESEALPDEPFDDHPYPEPSRDVSPFSDFQIDPALLALNPGFVPPPPNASKHASATHETEKVAGSPTAEDQTHSPLLSLSPYALPTTQQYTAAQIPSSLSATGDLNPQQIGTDGSFTFPPGLFAAAQDTPIFTRTAPASISVGRTTSETDSPPAHRTQSPPTVLGTPQIHEEPSDDAAEEFLPRRQSPARVAPRDIEEPSDDAAGEFRSPPIAFPVTRPALKPAPGPKTRNADAHQRGRSRGRYRGQSGRGRSSRVNQSPPNNLGDPNDPDKIRPIPAAVRRHVKAVNASQRKVPASTTKTTNTTVNTAGEYPLFTMEPTHAKRLRVPSRAFGGQVYETTARLDAAARCDEQLEIGSSKRKAGASSSSKKRSASFKCQFGALLTPLFHIGLEKCDTPTTGMYYGLMMYISYIYQL